MDKLNIKRGILIICIAWLLATAVFCILLPSETAYAESVIVENKVTCIVSADVIDGKVNYVRGDYVDCRYAKDIELSYTVNAQYYSVDFSVNDGNVVTGAISAVDGELLIKITQNGKVKVTVKAYNGDKTQIAEIEKIVYGDNISPEVPVFEGMERYCGQGEIYNAYIDTYSAADNLSGVGKVLYSVGSGEITEIDEIVNGISVGLSEAATISVYYFDNAFNCYAVDYVFDKFDLTAPPLPSFEVTPNSDLNLTGGYASSYNVQIDYGVDTQSGIAKRFYSVNGQAYSEYLSSFTVNREISYKFSAYSIDGVGNKSEVAEFILESKVDATAPSFTGITVSYDPTAATVAKIRLEIRDGLSGVDRVVIKGEDLTFTETVGGVYELGYDCYGKSSVDVTAFDKAGNFDTAHVNFNYFDKADISEKIKNLADWYKNADFTLYTQKSADDIKSAFERLGVMLASSVTTQENFRSVFKEIDALIDGTNKIIYSVESVPKYISGGLTYTVTESDFSDFLKGDEIKLVFSAVNNENLFVGQSGFGEGFSENFKLMVLYKGTDAGILENGLKISLNMPVGFYERKYALFDTETGEKYDIVCINNKIEFTLKKSSSLSLVIAGKPQQVAEKESKTVSVFGRKVDLGAFLGVVFGGVAFVIIGVVVVIVISKRRA